MSEAEEAKEVSREEAQELIEEGAQLVDVRADHEWDAGHIAGATHLPLDELAERAGELDPERPVVLYCRGGTRSAMAAEALGERRLRRGQAQRGDRRLGRRRACRSSPRTATWPSRARPRPILQARKKAAQTGSNTLIPVRFCYFPPQWRS